MELENLVRQRILDALQEQKLTQREAADLCDIPYATFVNYLQGRNSINMQTLRVIAHALGKPPEFFVAETPRAQSMPSQIASASEQLSESEQEEVLDFVRMKSRRARERNASYRTEPEIPPKKAQARRRKAA